MTPRFPDLTVCDIFLWALKKSTRSEKNRPKDLNCTECSTIWTNKQFNSLFNAMATRARLCSNAGGQAVQINGMSLTIDFSLFYTFVSFLKWMVIFINTLYAICTSFFNMLKVHDEFKMLISQVLLDVNVYGTY